MEDRLPITLQMKVAELLNDYPEIEDTLLSLSPAFAKLRNPVLRKTVARVTTLQQAAKVGGLNAGYLIQELRRAAGISDTEVVPDKEEGDFGDCPECFEGLPISVIFDARPLIDSGDTPMPKILKAMDDLKSGEVFELLTPFYPAPIIDTLRKKGYSSWSKKEAPDIVNTYFLRK